MKNKKLLVLLLLLVIGISGVFIAGTYAKYTASISKRSSVAIARWNFETDNNSETININLKDNYDESTLISSRTVDGKDYKIIAPGTEGSFSIDLVNTSDVGANFSISLDSVEHFPTNIKFYKDSNYQTEIIPGITKINGQLSANDEEGLTVTIYWKWIFETGSITNGIYSGDALDNEYGVLGEILEIPVTITGTQVRPGTNPITTHIN